MNTQQNISLKNYNTFGISVNAKRFVSINSYYDLQQLLKVEKDLFLISGGSNMLLTKDIEKLVVHIDIKGISIDREDDNFVYITVNAGENWHDFVRFCTFLFGALALCAFFLCMCFARFRSFSHHFELSPWTL